LPLRCILDGAGEASWNMAVDEALLHAGGPATLRLYSWSPHAVSLGYFQSAREFADLPAGTTLVRRLTGGGAIHHGDELTFSLCCDAGLLPADVAASYRLLHDAAAAALRCAGVACERLDAGANPAPRPAERWCFATPGRDDLVTAAGKVLGSAQRRIARPRPRVLHHGSLVLRRPAFTPFAAAVEDATAVDAAFVAQLRSGLVEHLALALGLAPEAGALSAGEAALAARLGERYRSECFLRRR
jgi:lipoate-protein ligase A